MFYEALMVVKYLPKVTLSYVVITLLYGAAISNIALTITVALDLLDYLPI